MNIARGGTAERGTAMHARDALDLYLESPLTSPVMHCCAASAASVMASP